MRKMLITEAIHKITNGAITCASVKSAVTTLYLLLELGFDYVSIEEEEVRCGKSGQ
jgi:hypothetical protein